MLPDHHADITGGEPVTELLVAATPSYDLTACTLLYASRLGIADPSVHRDSNSAHVRPGENDDALRVFSWRAGDAL